MADILPFPMPTAARAEGEVSTSPSQSRESNDVETSLIASRSRRDTACAVDDVSTSSIASPFDRSRFRTQVEAAAQACLDMAHGCFAVLDRLDGDADFEPDADGEDDGTAEPVMAALVTIAGIRWTGFDGGAP